MNTFNSASVREFQPTLPQAQEHRLALRFTGSGSEYFRIWLVNLLLTLVTLGLYHPWAKVRRLRYFHGNTLVGGHALDFHGNPWKMLRGYLLVGAMVVLYSVAGSFSPVAGLIAFFIVAALWPALLKSSMQFRLANTSWRGLRFRFRGTLGGAYRAILPLFVPGLIIVAALAGVDNPEQPPAWYAVVVGAVVLGMLVVGPWLWWNLKKYQHDNYSLGQEQTQLDCGVGSFYGVFLKTIGVGLLAGLAMGVLGAIVAVAGIAGVALGGGGEGGAAGRGAMAAFVITMVIMLVGLLVVQLLPRPYFTSRMQNLLWSRTGSATLQFQSALRFWPLLGLTLKNWLLMVLTLGLYWPFAAVAMARMRLEAIEVVAGQSPDRLFQQAQGAEGDAAGDAAGDLFGLDIGL
jgi:uncharacterized membrane protein YjgN (DUF898 family)